MQRAITELHRYVDPGSFTLVHKIAETFGVRPSQVITGSGVDALLSYTVKTFTEHNDQVLTSEGTFIGIYVNVNKHHRQPESRATRRITPTISTRCCRASIAGTKLIYLANPNNPTGTIFSAEQFERFMAKVPKNILVILDEAYFSYAKANPAYPNGLTYNYENLIVMRTFSKDYGLAGIRVGFAIGPEYLIREMYKVKLPFEPNFMAQKAAIASLDDAEFLQMTIETNARNMKRMVKAFTEIGIPQVRSDANFILLLLPNEQLALDFNLRLSRSRIDRPACPVVWHTEWNSHQYRHR